MFAEDVAASGGYLLACAGDEIYADPSSIVGSIGVITATFGVNELINRIGVQRRVYTAGESKDTLDPFLPEKPADVERIKSLQRDVHEAFIDLVKSRRGAKLDKAGINLFTGEFWSGKKALELGLIDGLSDLRTKMREVYGDDVRLKPVTPSTSWFRRRRSVVCRGRRIRARLVSWRLRRRSHLGDRGSCALVAFRVLGDAATPHLRRGRRGVVSRRALVSRHAAAHRVGAARRRGGA